MGSSISHFLFCEVQCDCFYVEVFDPFGLEFMHGDRYGSVFILLQVDIQLFKFHLLNMLSFFYFILLVSLSKIQVFLGMWIDTWVFDMIPLVFLSVFMSILGITVALW